jgi:hypothetical protein
MWNATSAIVGNSSHARRVRNSEGPYTVSFTSSFRAMSVAVFLLLGACASETLFRSNFDVTPVNSPPAVAQSVGTANVDGPPGSVIIIAAPVSPSGKWVRVSRPTGPAVAGMQGKFAQFRGDGVYTFSATMFMPPDAGVATIQFEPFRNTVSDLSAFLHLDFMPDNTVRLDDIDASKFGSFTRGQPFIVQVTLNINASSSTAHVVLAGATASGVKDYTILAPFQASSREFGAVRIWQGFPHTGGFDATNIVVTRRSP